MRLRLVRAIFAFSIQQSHSLRASGVRSSHAARTALSAVRVFFRSRGTSCTTPMAIFILGMHSG